MLSSGMASPLAKILKFLHEAEKLKTVLRHSWLSNGRRESVAEHSWRMAIMAMVLHNVTDKSINLSRVIKMILVHDLAEIYAGDDVAWKKKKEDKSLRELKSFKKIVKDLPKQQSKEFMGLWQEYELSLTPEALFAKALDKLEVVDQHNLASIKTWAKAEYAFQKTHGYKHVAYSKKLTKLRDIIKKQSQIKIKRNK